MTTINKNIILDRSIPEFIKDDYPLLETFLSAYYEFLEQEKSPNDISKNLRNYRDSDTTLDDFSEFIFNEYLKNFPKEIIADKTLVSQHIKQFYLNKGNEESFRFIFRVLFGEEISFYYPKEDILKASDGAWYIQNIVKIPYSPNIDITNVIDKNIIGNISGASATIVSALRYTERNVEVIELTIENIRGSFNSNEAVKIFYDNNGSTTYYSTTLIDLYNSITITNRAGHYSENDNFPIRDDNNDKIANGVITHVTYGPVTGIVIDDGGHDYNGRYAEISKFYGLPGNYTWNGIYLPDEPTHGGSFDFADEPTNFIIDTEILDGIGDILVVTDDASSSGNGATGYVETVNEDGTILDITITNFGNLYQNPKGDIASDTGSDVELTMIGGGGSISTAKIGSFTIKLNTDVDVYADFTGIGDGFAEGTLSTGPVGTFIGRYLDDNGQPSSSKKLQDNYYYQDYSYVIKSGLTFSSWNKAIQNIIHPAGLLLFGEVTSTSITSSNDSSFDITSYMSEIDNFIYFSSDDFDVISSETILTSI